MGSRDRELSWDSSEVEEFREKYKSAKEKEKKTFFYQGNEYVLNYAKYLLEYIDIKKNGS